MRGLRHLRSRTGSSLAEVAVSLALWGLLVEILASWLVLAWGFYRQDLIRQQVIVECARVMEELRVRNFDDLPAGTLWWTPEDPRLQKAYGMVWVLELGPYEKMIRVSLHRDGEELYALVSWAVAGITR